MEFNPPKGIYQQIADQVRERILRGEWPGGARIPSVRELAVNMGVNPNTVTRSYQSLLDGLIIENRRGIGYFVTQEAKEKIVNEMRAQCIGEELPRLFEMMKNLGISIEEVVEAYRRNEREVSK